MAQRTGPRPDQATRDAVTERIFAHARKNWPRVEVLVRHSGACCYVAVLEPTRTRRRRLFTTKPDEREPFPVLRLRYQDSADRWLIAIHKASSDSWSESELPTRFGPPSAPRTGHGPHLRLLDRPTRALTSNPHTASLAARQAI